MVKRNFGFVFHIRFLSLRPNRCLPYKGRLMFLYTQEIGEIYLRDFIYSWKYENLCRVDIGQKWDY